MAKLTMLKPRLAAMTANRVTMIEPTKRIAGNSLYALIKRFERNNPRVCAECKRNGLVSYGAELDHIYPLHLGGSNALDNLQWLCVEHHQEKSKREEKNRAGGV